jgi:hypothetical protein
VTSYVTHLFRCVPIGGTAHVADDESLAVGWFWPETLPSPIAPRLRAARVMAREQERTGAAWFRS